MNKTKDIIHKYLAFTVLLPKHPFSSDLLRALLVVGPMFPSVSFVTGTGYEFRDMCTQYNVRSFPQILFFKVRVCVRVCGGSLPPSLPTSEHSMSFALDTTPRTAC